MRKEKGITLVSLVVTIIILIILAGISINTLVGENGIIIRAQQAKGNIALAKQKEEEQLNELYEQLEGSNQGIPPEEGTIGDLTNKLQDLQNKFDTIQAEYSDFKTTIANAITEKGIETLETDTEETMAENIKNLGGISGYKRIYPSSPYTVVKTGTIFFAAGYNNQTASASISGCTLVSGTSVLTGSASRMYGSGYIGIAREGDVVSFGYSLGGGDWSVYGTAVFEPI